MKHQHFHLILTAFCLAALSLSVSPARSATQSTTIMVNSKSDGINSTDGKCTLREAVIAANTDTASGSVSGECEAGSGADTILLMDGTYALTLPGDGEDAAATGDMDITSSVRISGKGSFCPTPGPTCTEIDASNGDRIFHVLPGGVFSLDHVQIEGGDEGDGWGGGGIVVDGSLNLDHVLVIANTTTTVGGGLSVNSSGVAVVTNSSFGNNSAHSGGAIAAAGTLVMGDSSVTFNTAAEMGGGIFNNGGEVTWNTGNASYNQTTLANGSGGGIYNGGYMVLSNVLVDHNTTLNPTTPGRYGGGIYNNGYLDMRNSLVEKNSAGELGGGIYTMGLSNRVVYLTNTTLEGNTARNGGALVVAGSARGTFSYVTISGNDATVDGGAIYLDTSSPVHIGNSIISGNGKYDCYINSGSLTSDGYNIENSDWCGLRGLNDQYETDPMLNSLANNGGFTKTFSLQGGSPAIDAANPNECPATDQRGYFRPADGDDNDTRICDIGAFELNAFPYGTFLPLIIR